MAILGVVNRIIDFDEVSGAISHVTSGASFDSNYVPNSMVFDTSAYGQKNFVAAAGVVTWFRFTHFRSSTSGSGGGTSNAIEIRDAAGTLILSANKTSTTSSSHNFTLYGAANVTSGSFAMSTSVQTVITIKIDNTGSGCVATIYTGTAGAVFATLTVVDRQTRTNPTSFLLRPSFFNYSGGSSIHISEVIIADTSLIGRRLILVTPSAAGDLTDFAGTVAGLNDLDALTGLTSNAAGQRHTWTNAAYAGPAGTLEAVIVATVGHRTSGAPSQLAASLRIASTNYDGADATVLDVTKGQAIWTLNPNTGAAWASGALATMQTGIKSAA